MKPAEKLKTFRKYPGSYLKSNHDKEDLDKDINLSRSTSVGRFFEKFRTKVFGKPLSITIEGGTPSDHTLQELRKEDKTAMDCGGDTTNSDKTLKNIEQEYKCHLCNFSTDRITLLDRHLLDEHEIGLDNLLKLVIAQTRINGNAHGRHAYYQPSNACELDDMSLFETIRNLSPRQQKQYVTVGTNTPCSSSGKSLKNSCDEVNKQLENLLSIPMEKYDHNALLSQVTLLSEVMSNIIESSNAMQDLNAKPNHGSDISAFRLDDGPNRGINTSPMRGLDTSPIRDLDTNRGLDISPIRGFDTSPVRGMDTSPLRDLNTSPIRSFGACTNYGVGTSSVRGFGANLFHDFVSSPDSNSGTGQSQGLGTSQANDLVTRPANSLSTSQPHGSGTIPAHRFGTSRTYGLGTSPVRGVGTSQTHDINNPIRTSRIGAIRGSNNPIWGFDAGSIHGLESPVRDSRMKSCRGVSDNNRAFFKVNQDS